MPQNTGAQHNATKHVRECNIVCRQTSLEQTHKHRRKTQYVIFKVHRD